ncbi:NAD(P)H-binding protein [Streptomyces sp. NBC_01275]|uniref:NAD(P)-dependent oxidoreductase n=1 Tax=Streptomyces sp. NBC_01275 TaxID=2903807 RepID=UPI0022519BB6|nr:NAD(P)H-binding protein [Streptomyces sp. NBC_01275]MCX4761183.1 NAD(P)H-binding protein [Streptomyces sp. NBC_01275]
MAGIVVLGAGGRAGRAVTAEARRRGLTVTAAVRDPERYAGLGAPGVTVVRGDVLDRRSVEDVAGGHIAAVQAVSPFSGPEQGFATLDPAFFVKAADALLDGLADARVRRLVAVGLFANLLGPDGRPVMDDPTAFPPEIRPFALAHTAGLARLRKAGNGDVDWVMLTPGGGLEADGPRTGRHRFGDERMPDGIPGLSYADLAAAVLDEIEKPTLHRTRVSVYGPRRKEKEKAQENAKAT